MTRSPPNSTPNTSTSPQLRELAQRLASLDGGGGGEGGGDGVWRPIGSSKRNTRKEILAFLGCGTESLEGLRLGRRRLTAFMAYFVERMGMQRRRAAGGEATGLVTYLVESSLRLFGQQCSVRSGANEQDNDNADGRVITGAGLELFLEGFSKRPLDRARHPKKVAVLGGGAFGTALAAALARKGHSVTILMRSCEAAHVHNINHSHCNSLCFPAHRLPTCCAAAVVGKEQGKAALRGADFIVSTCPVQFLGPFLHSLKQSIGRATPVISASKGIQTGTLQLPHEIIRRCLGRDVPTAFLAGPSFAQGIMECHPTCVSVASCVPGLARAVQILFSSRSFRVYTGSDVVGVELCAALKNVLALACGLVKGLGYGPNTQAAVVTRGWADIKTLNLRLGGRQATLTGLAGLGDLMMTCFGGLSRNCQFGRAFAATGDEEAALQASKGVVEGLPTAVAAAKLATREGLDCPVLQLVADAVEGRLAPGAFVDCFMALPLSPEDQAQEGIGGAADPRPKL